MTKGVPKYSRSWEAVRRIKKAMDGDIIFLDSSLFSVEDVEKIRNHIRRTSHPRARVLFVSGPGGIKKLNKRQLENIIATMNDMDGAEGEDGDIEVEVDAE